MRTLTYEITSENDGSKVLYFLKGKAGLSSRLIRSLKLVDELNPEYVIKEKKGVLVPYLDMIQKDLDEREE